MWGEAGARRASRTPLPLAEVCRTDAKRAARSLQPLGRAKHTLRHRQVSRRTGLRLTADVVWMGTWGGSCMDRHMGWTLGTSKAYRHHRFTADLRAWPGADRITVVCGRHQRRLRRSRRSVSRQSCGSGARKTESLAFAKRPNPNLYLTLTLTLTLPDHPET